MKKTILLLFIFLNLSVHAQLSNRFYGGGNASLNQSVGVYVSNVTVGAAWRDIQYYPTSSYVWTNLDATIQANQTAGLRTMITLKCTSPITLADTTPGTCAYIFNSQFSDNGSSWWPYDTTKWKTFVNALVDRYDGDGINDASWLNTNYRITQWHIGQEWQRIWCTQNPPDSLSTAQEFTKYVNMTYAVIKAKQPLSQISFAGIDTRHDLEAYYDGYSTQKTICVNQSCTSPVTINNPSQVGLIPGFIAKRRNVLYILRNALSDEIDIHQYGRWTEIPKVVQWLKDSANLGNRKVVFYEGGGPFCKSCENISHSVNDTDGRLPAALVRDNASYVVYYFITGFSSEVKNMHWHIGSEYTIWGATWGDLNLMSINYVPKPSFYTYRWLAKTVFSNQDADTVVRVQESNSYLYHYRINPMGLHIIWSTSVVDSFIVNGTGTLYRWDIPTTCNSVYPTACDSVVQTSSVNVSGSTTITLTNGVPVFYSWGNVLTEVSESRSFIPTIPTLYQNYPNPFNPTTTIRFSIPQHSYVTLKIFDVLGREVATLVDGELNLGVHSVVFNARGLASGVYFYQLIAAGGFIEAKKMFIIK